MNENVIATLQGRNESMAFAAAEALHRSRYEWISHRTIRTVK